MPEREPQENKLPFKPAKLSYLEGLSPTEAAGEQKEDEEEVEEEADLVGTGEAVAARSSS
jgi:hypothetical protein